MSDIICVTRRVLCGEDFGERLRRLAAARPKALILREKDLSSAAYRELSRPALALCREAGTLCILHNYTEIALELGCSALHLPLPRLKALPEAERAAFTVLGASCHSVDEALAAEALGCTYITAGHVFDTGCKPDLPGRGLEYLTGVCRAVRLPVYAIGGVTPENYAAVRACGAAGACVMSGAMTCADPAAYLAAFEEK
ncbi:MAG: thiamine phosphate synthase [Firmicutes bacterium]|nr:thiamine phosphate synthase [Bacillota bacterium]